MKRKFRILRVWYYGKLNLSKKIYIRIREEKYIETRERFFKTMREKYYDPNFSKFIESLKLDNPQCQNK